MKKLHFTSTTNKIHSHSITKLHGLEPTWATHAAARILFPDEWRSSAYEERIRTKFPDADLTVAWPNVSKRTGIYHSKCPDDIDDMTPDANTNYTFPETDPMRATTGPGSRILEGLGQAQSKHKRRETAQAQHLAANMHLVTHPQIREQRKHPGPELFSNAKRSRYSIDSADAEIVEALRTELEEQKCALKDEVATRRREQDESSARIRALEVQIANMKELLKRRND